MTPDRTLVPMGEDLWIVNNPHKWLGLDTRGRMVVMRLADGSLVLHSPVPIDDTLAQAMAELGPVAHLIAPNTYHHVYVSDVQARYPDAKVWIADGLQKKRKDLKFDGVLDDATQLWPGEIEHRLFAGAPLFNEHVFFHRKSGAILFTDVLMNIHRVDGFLSKIVFKLEGVLRKTAVPRLLKFTVKDKAAARESVSRWLEWPYSQVIMSHGEPLTGPDARAITEQAFAWLKPAPKAIEAA
ncbi:MAG: DUF4336 domain-containing protein [Bradymonadia bacterium]